MSCHNALGDSESMILSRADFRILRGVIECAVVWDVWSVGK